MNRKIFVSFIAALTGLFIYSACTKIDTTELGSDLIPAVDNVNTFDTVLEVVTNNMLFSDSTSITGSEPHAIGVIADDPEFGKTEAAAYFSITPSFYGSYPFVNRDSVEIDSVVLSLPYTDMYGDSNAIEDFEVFEIDPNSGFTDSIYRISTTPFTLLPTVLGKKQVVFYTLNDSVHYVNHATSGNDSITAANLLRIKLDTAFGRKFVNYDTASQYKNDSIFRDNFPGLAVKINEATSPLKTALSYFNLTSSGRAVELRFYCRVTKGGQVDTISPAFSYNGRAQANLVQRNPAHGFDTYLTNGSDNDDLGYIQSTPGSYVTVKIPGLSSLSNRVVHRAELIVEKVPTAQDDIYTPPSLLFIDAVNETGDSTFTIRSDFVYTGSGLGYDATATGGIYRSEKYVFNLSRYVQSIVTRHMRSHTLRISAPYYTYPYFEAADGSASRLPSLLFVNSPIAAGRVVVGGGSHASPQKMRLRIIYSKI